MKNWLLLLKKYPLFTIGFNLFHFLAGHNYFPLEDEKYSLIRPVDVFIYVSTCGVAVILFIISAILTFWLISFPWDVSVFCLLTTLLLVLIRVVGITIVNRELEEELKRIHSKK